LSRTINLKEHNRDRFQRRDTLYAEVENNKRADDRANIARNEHKLNLADELFRQRDIELSKKMESSRLRHSDAVQNQLLERKRKQEFQDFVLKNEFQRNAINAEAAFLSQRMIDETKRITQSIER
jgi:hypothetical protein